MKRLGLTGSIGAGKSTVAGLLRDRGLRVLDADAVARELSLTPGVLADVVRLLGSAFVVCEDGQPVRLNRPALAALVFADEEKRGVLNGILHPRARARLAQQERLAAQQGETWVVQDVPLLFKSGSWERMDAVLLVDAPLEVRLARVRLRDGLSAQDVLARDAAQMPVAQKRALMQQRPGALLDNSRTLDHLSAQLRSALDRLGIPAGPQGGPTRPGPAPPP